MCIISIPDEEQVFAVPLNIFGAFGIEIACVGTGHWEDLTLNGALKCSARKVLSKKGWIKIRISNVTPAAVHYFVEYLAGRITTMDEMEAPGIVYTLLDIYRLCYILAPNNSRRTRLQKFVMRNLQGLGPAQLHEAPSKVYRQLGEQYPTFAGYDVIRDEIVANVVRNWKAYKTGLKEDHTEAEVDELLNRYEDLNKAVLMY
jgi:hypothetical protein